MVDYFLIAGGLAFLFVGGEALVRGAVVSAERLGVSPLFIGLVVVGFGTSAPELVVCLEAALRDQPDIAMGNVVGSNTANVLLILGTAGLISPITGRLGFMRRDCGAMLLAAVVLLLLGAMGRITLIDGALMLLGLCGFIAFSYLTERRRNGGASSFIEREMEDLHSIRMGPVLAALAILFGLMLLIFGSRMLVSGAVEIARFYGVSEAVIGLSLVAVGTSLPELATGIVAAYRRQPDVAIGNVLGSNVFNILGMLGMTAVVAPFDINPAMARFDVPVMLISSLLLAFFLMSGRSIDRGKGGLMLIAYAAYMVAIFSGYSGL